MYNNPSAPLAAGGTGALAMTGFNSVWLILAAFAFLALGTALMRIAPTPARAVASRPGHWSAVYQPRHSRR
ncbi:MAG: hypothetical protein WBG36_17610 [Ornithinimicrobium sp.]